MQNKKKILVLTLLIVIQISVYAQMWEGGNQTTTINGGTSFQAAHSNWGNQVGLLFNSYSMGPDAGFLNVTSGTVKNRFEAGNYQNGAGAIIFTGNGGGMEFFIGDVSAGVGSTVTWGTPKFTIQRNGRVGIGTSNLNSMLTVAGDIHSREVKVTVNAGADYVFEDEFKLMPLSEVSRFIRLHKHLPEVQPANDMIANGLELGKMEITLLKKIEEMTLYMIQFSGELEKLKMENEELRTQISALQASGK